MHPCPSRPSVNHVLRGRPVMPFKLSKIIFFLAYRLDLHDDGGTARDSLHHHHNHELFTTKVMTNICLCFCLSLSPHLFPSNSRSLSSSLCVSRVCLFSSPLSALPATGCITTTTTSCLPQRIDRALGCLYFSFTLSPCIR